MESTGKFERQFFKILQEDTSGAGMTAGAGGAFGMARQWALYTGLIPVLVI